jgi:hypothetical protein
MTPLDAPTTLPPLRRIGPGVAGLFSFAIFLTLPLLPFAGIFLALLAPLPLLHYASGGRPSVLAWGWVVVALLGAALVHPVPWLLALACGYLLVAALPALSVELRIRIGWSTGRWAAAVAGTALVGVSGFVVGLFGPADPVGALLGILADGAREAEELTRAFRPAGSGSEDTWTWALHSVAFLTPALVALYATAAAFWVRPRLPLLGLGTAGENFDEYRSEEWLPVGFVVGGLGWALAGGVAKWFASNLFAVVLGLYFIHGLAIIHYYLGRRLGGNRWVRLGVALFALQLPVALVLSAVGLADNFFALRRGRATDGGEQE